MESIYRCSIIIFVKENSRSGAVTRSPCRAGSPPRGNSSGAGRSHYSTPCGHIHTNWTIVSNFLWLTTLNGFSTAGSADRPKNHVYRWMSGISPYRADCTDHARHNKTIARSEHRFRVSRWQRWQRTIDPTPRERCLSVSGQILTAGGRSWSNKLIENLCFGPRSCSTAVRASLAWSRGWFVRVDHPRLVVLRYNDRHILLHCCLQGMSIDIKTPKPKTPKCQVDPQRPYVDGSVGPSTGYSTFLSSICTHGGRPWDRIGRCWS